jgi:acetyl esterase/lipase
MAKGRPVLTVDWVMFHRAVSPRTLRSAVVSLVVILQSLVASMPAAAVPLLAPSATATTAEPTVGASMIAEPVGQAAVGTMILIHGGGWLGPNDVAQHNVMDDPGRLLLDRGWRVVSIDYAEGTRGLQNILDSVGSGSVPGAGLGPLCLYGESAGAQLALVAASRLPAVDCVIGVGTPTDLALLQSDTSSSADPDVRAVASRLGVVFGTTAAQLSEWSPLGIAASIPADVMLIHESNDPLVSLTHAMSFQATVPTTQVVELEPGDPGDPSTAFRHGTVSPLGRTRYAAAVGTFADRARSARDAGRMASKLHCGGYLQSMAVVGLPAMTRSLRCLARHDRRLHASRGPARPRPVTLRPHGLLNAARLWATLRATSSGRRVLVELARGRATVVARLGSPSRVRVGVLRSAPGA